MSLASHLSELAGDGAKGNDAAPPRTTARSGKARERGTPYALEALRREVSNVATAPEGERNNTLNNAAFSVGQLVGGSELAEDFARAELVAAAATAGLSGVEVGATIRSGMDSGKLQPRNTPARAASDAGPSAPTEPAWLSVSDIFEPLEPMRWLVQALDVAAGAPVLLAGYGFSGKTVAAQALAVAIAAGLPAWGSLAVRQGSVRHFDFEQGSRLTRERYQRLALGLDVSPADLDGRLALWALPRFTFDSPGAEDALCRWLDGVDLAIIDSFRAACPSIDENSSEARLPLDMLCRVSERTGCVPLVIHHARKPSQNAVGGAKMAIRGSGALFDACSSVLCFEGVKGAPTRVSHEKARNTGRPADDFSLRIVDTEGGGLLVATERAAEGFAAASPDARFAALQDQVREFFRVNGAQVDKDVIRERLGVRKQSLVAAMQALVSSGELVQGGTRKAPTWALSEGVGA